MLYEGLGYKDILLELGAVCLQDATGGLSSQKVLNLSLDSRKTNENTGFIAAPGASTASVDGRHFIEKALNSGAPCVLTTLDVAIPEDCQAAWFECENPRKVGAQCIEIMAGSPSKSLDLIGVTGTNGKSTITFMLASLLNALDNDQQNAVFGTLGVGSIGALKQHGFTTPEAEILSGTLQQLRSEGFKRVCMEVSSHGLALDRVAGMCFKVAAFSNLSQDHLDFHGDMQEYFNAKKILFSVDLLPEGTAILPLNFKNEHAEVAAHTKRVYWDLHDSAADIWASQVLMHPKGISFILHFCGSSYPLDLPIFGMYNLENYLVVAACALALGYDRQVIVAHSASIKAVPGRFERVVHPKGPLTIVDYAHTPDAVDNLLKTAVEICRHKVIIVLGCGGDRDQEKRPLMGIAAAKNADIVIITDDNPRSEDPAEIRQMMQNGVLKAGMTDFDGQQGYLNIGDREAAISKAIFMAEAEDIVLIAGKGHEKTQTVGTQKFDFDDCAMSLKYLKKKWR